MEYVITNDQSFEEIETQAIGALQQEGFVVQRTFSLRSAIASSKGQAEAGPGYSVLMLFAAGDRWQALGLVTLYERAGQTVIQPHLAPTGSRDAEAEILAALRQGGLDVCVDTTGGGRCTTPQSRSREGDAWVRDPVCGKELRQEQGLFAMQYQGKRYFACGPRCQAEFERNPARYAPA